MMSSMIVLIGSPRVLLSLPEAYARFYTENGSFSGLQRLLESLKVKALVGDESEFESSFCSF